MAPPVPIGLGSIIGINFIAKLNDRESDVYDDDGKLKPESIRMLMLQYGDMNFLLKRILVQI